MARATLVKSAQSDIYSRGKRVEYVSQKGKREGQTLSKIDRTQPFDENDTVLIHKGEPYYWWQFLNGGKNISKTQPRQSQLTQSEFMSQYYSIQEQIEDMAITTAEELSEFVESLKSDAETLRDETQEKLDSMPDSLQSSPTGELLQERIDEMEEIVSQLENIEVEYEEDMDDINTDVASDNDIDTDVEGWETELSEEDVEAKKEEKLQEFIDEKVEEIKEISFNL